MSDRFDPPMVQPGHRFRLGGGGKMIGRPREARVKMLSTCGDSQVCGRILCVGRWDSRADRRKLGGQLVSDRHKLVVQFVVLHSCEDLMVPVQPADIAIVSLPPQADNSKSFSSCLARRRRANKFIVAQL